MPHMLMLSDQFTPLVTSKKQNAFFTYLQQRYPHAIRTNFGIMLGNPEEAKLVLSAQLSRDPSGIAVLMELLGILTEQNRKSICFVFSSQRVVFPNKLHIRIGDLIKGNVTVISASAAAQKLYGSAVKKAFLPTKICALHFKKAEALFTRCKKDQTEIRISSTQHRKLFVPRPASRITQFHSDPPCVKLVCEGIARLIKAI